MQGVVRKRTRNDDCEPLGVVNQNPLLDTRKFEVQYLGGFVEKMTVNHITENMLLQVESEENHFILLKEITYQFKDSSAVNNNNCFLARNSGNLYANKKTRLFIL